MRIAIALCLFAATFFCRPAAADLAGYVGREDAAYTWSLSGSEDRYDGSVFMLHLVSQVWQGTTWQHEMRVYIPRNAPPSGTLLLLIGGGSPRPGDDEFALQMAAAARAPCAIVYGIPNQPLFGDKYEDDLIAETFVRFLKTGDEDWPLLLPMTKGVVKAMDALQAFAKQRLPAPIERFVVTGASKRGWTSWLVAAVDARVAAIAPRVFDMVNIPEQLPHQLASWGTYSEMLRPYVQPGLPNFLGTPAGRRLVEMVDPFSYRDRLGIPKLMILGTNDRYWTLDAPSLFWHALPGARAVRYVPNAGHSLGEPKRWTETLACFFRSVAANRDLPATNWTLQRDGATLRWEFESSQRAIDIQLWYATSETRDFREARWESRAASLARGELTLSPDRYTAAFAEAAYEIDGEVCPLTTLVHIEPPAGDN